MLGRGRVKKRVKRNREREREKERKRDRVGWGLEEEAFAVFTFGIVEFPSSKFYTAFSLPLSLPPPLPPMPVPAHI